MQKLAGNNRNEKGWSVRVQDSHGHDGHVRYVHRTVYHVLCTVCVYVCVENQELVSLYRLLPVCRIEFSQRGHFAHKKKKRKKKITASVNTGK